MRIFVLFLLLILLDPWSRANTPIDKDLSSKVSNILEEWSKLKPGTTRSELLKSYITEGGLSGVERRTFVSQRCSYIKVDVTFTLTEPNQKVELPTDTIKSISKPYLEWSITD